MKNALILHGMPSKEGFYNPKSDSQSNCHWIPWLQHQLLIRDIFTQTPEWPKPYEPVYKDWLAIFNQFKVDEESVLVGHSCGGGFLVRWLSETDIKINQLVLVAPWMDPDKKLSDSFFEFEIDNSLIKKANTIDILYSTDDDEDILESVRQLKQALKDVSYHEFKNHGHFCLGDMNTREFPELLEIILGSEQ